MNKTQLLVQIIEQEDRIEFLKNQVADLNAYIIWLKKLLKLYQKKRDVDGLNGRTWDAMEHGKLDKAITRMEKKGPN